MKSSSSGSSPSTCEHYDSIAQLLHKDHYYNKEQCVILDSLETQQQICLATEPKQSIYHKIIFHMIDFAVVNSWI
ncbi:hypothetical protein BLOT_003959 [Blomia tropicalis]|nr:hypothetical protein BLOT_003959 [Blomia tropicalis]